ncbi:MAG: Sulfite exporter TauE/SafE [Chloroflexi bacterium OLB15]|nr:MAG: Sulfite exporter TauE/SafE [Chloroflexi bacterium OLB15]
MTYVVLALVGLLIGLSKGGLGAPLAMLVIPLLSLVMPVPSAIGLSLPLLIVGDGIAIIMFWKTWDLDYVKRMLPTTIIGIVIGTLLLAALPDLTLRRVLGIFTLIFVAYRLISERLTQFEYQPRYWHAHLAGWLSGMGSALANTGAPPFLAYLLLQPLSPITIVGTTTLFFALVNLIKLPGMILTGVVDFHEALGSLWVIPVIIGAVFMGRWIIQRINQRVFEYVLLFTLFVTALFLLFVQSK